MPQPSRPVYVTPAGLAATLIVFALAALFVRLGFWQLERLEQRRRTNAEVAERLELPPLRLETLPSDTAGLSYRRLELEGTYDEARSIVWAGRAYRGAPGVHVLTPLRLDGRTAILVDRGWLPAPDAATVDLEAYRVSGRMLLSALALPLPAAREDARGAALPETRTWFRPDAELLRGEFPYTIADVYAQALPEPGAPARPVRQPLPVLDQGPHLGYAIQWFSFAAIALIGWGALVLRRSKGTPEASSARG